MGIMAAFWMPINNNEIQERVERPIIASDCEFNMGVLII